MSLKHESVWITANAGSGKTTELTRVVVRLMLLGVPPERIVCITYTKAAASEMRTRILKRLRKLLMLGDAACAAYIEKEILRAKPTAEQLQRARNLFAQVLDSPTGGLQLTTIHGFCQDILRRFPLEAGIAPHFTVLEDAAADELLHRAKHSLLQGLDSADASLADALSLIGARGGESRFNTLADDVIRHKRHWKNIWAAQSEESLRAHIYALHGFTSVMREEQLTAQFCSLPEAADATQLRASLPRMLAHKKKTENKYGKGLAEWLELPPESRVVQVPALCKLILTDGLQRKDIAKLEDYNGGDSAIARFAAAVERYVTSLAALRCAEESIAVAIFAKHLQYLYDAEKESAQALDFDDLITRTLQLVSMPEMVGWVMSKLDHRIDHLLIDEAQDNSGEQWQLAHILVDELIAANDGVGSAGLPRSLLVVGDEKQSIYSFQGAAPEEFDSRKNDFRNMLSESLTGFSSAELLNSYRSAPAIVKFVDKVCANPQVARALTSSGEVPEHTLTRHEAAGCIVRYPMLAKPAKDKAEPMQIPREYPLGGSAAQQLADSITQEIAQWLEEKRPLSGHSRPVRAGDILILVQNRGRLVPTLIRTLQRAKIPVAGIDRLTLSGHLAVSDLLALMRWCTNPQDDLALAQVLRSPLLGFSDEQLLTIAYDRKGSLWSEVRGEAREWLHAIQQQANRTPYDFLTQVLEVSNKRLAFAARFGEEVHEVLDELKLQACQLPETSLPTLAQFHELMTSSHRQIKRQQEEEVKDHVRIMTVHGAKGLEAPLVILADTVSLPDTSKERFFTITTPQQQQLPVLAMSAAAKEAPALATAKQARRDKLMAEYYRLLYVAITRARDELHIFGAGDKDGDAKEGTWYDIMEAAMVELPVQEMNGAFVMADVSTATKTKSESAAHTPPEALPAWATQAAPQQQATIASIAPSRVAAPSAPYAVAMNADARTRGVRIHRILELLTADSDAEHIEKLVQHIGPDWQADTRKQVLSQVAQLFQSEHWLWEYERWPEATIQGVIEQGGTQFPVNGQMDLLVKTPEGLAIIDYKTGSNVPTTAQEVPESYVQQLKLYHTLVSRLYPHQALRCAILWTHNAKLMWLDEAVARSALTPNGGGNPPLAA